ncbi:MAG: HDOD domain-containing protein, partial [Fibrobacterota bacterium]
EEVAQYIEQDPALTSKLLKLANSVFYGIPRSISSVRGAVVILGFNTIRSLVLSVSVVKLFPVKTPVFNRAEFWQHCIASAIAAKIVTKNFHKSKLLDPESAFCSALLHDIGKLVFEQFVNQDYSKAIKKSVSEKIPSYRAEESLLDINHSDVGRILASKWNLPLDIEESILYHHFPESAPSNRELVYIVHLSDWIAHSLGSKSVCYEPNPEMSPQTKDLLSLTDEELSSLRGTIADEIKNSSLFFNIINS